MRERHDAIKSRMKQTVTQKTVIESVRDDIEQHVNELHNNNHDVHPTPEITVLLNAGNISRFDKTLNVIVHVMTHQCMKTHYEGPRDWCIALKSTDPISFVYHWTAYDRNIRADHQKLVFHGGEFDGISVINERFNHTVGQVEGFTLLPTVLSDIIISYQSEQQVGDHAIPIESGFVMKTWPWTNCFRYELKLLLIV